jgi:hypothetical protein
METALRQVLTSTFAEYVTGIEKADTSSFPIVLRNLKLIPKKVNEDMEDTPFNMDEGSIGMVKIQPGWLGNVDVEASGIKVKLSFSAVKAAKLAMRPPSIDNGNQDLFLTGAAYTAAAPVVPAAPMPPQWCPKHDTSDKRVKTEPHDITCLKCGIVYTASYDGAVLCPGCSATEKRCLICGAGVEKESSYIPAAKARDAASLTVPNGNLQPSPSAPRANLLPSDSMPVLNKDGLPSGPLPPAPPPVPSQVSKPPPQAYTNMYGRTPVPGPTPVPMSGQRMPQGRRPPQEDDETFLDFLRNLACNVGGFDADEYEVGPSRGRPATQRGFPPPTR